MNKRRQRNTQAFWASIEALAFCVAFVLGLILVTQVQNGQLHFF